MYTNTNRKPATIEEQIQGLIRMKDKIKNEFLKVNPLIEILKTLNKDYSTHLEDAPDIVLMLEFQQEHHKISKDLVDKHVLKINEKINELLMKMKSKETA